MAIPEPASGRLLSVNSSSLPALRPGYPNVPTHAQRVTREKHTDNLVEYDGERDYRQRRVDEITGCTVKIVQGYGQRDSALRAPCQSRTRS
jgi:hypothetical protein